VSGNDRFFISRPMPWYRQFFRISGLAFVNFSGLPGAIFTKGFFYE